MLANIKKVRYFWLIGGVAIAVQEMVALIGLGPLLDPLVALTKATGGVLSPTLLLSLTDLIINVVILIIVFGGLKPADLGLVRAKILSALGISLLFYLVLQLVSLMLQVVTGGPLALNDGLHDGAFSNLIGQWFGNALYEETFWRGFWFIQLALILKTVA